MSYNITSKIYGSGSTEFDSIVESGDSAEVRVYKSLVDNAPTLKSLFDNNVDCTSDVEWILDVPEYSVQSPADNFQRGFNLVGDYYAADLAAQTNTKTVCCTLRFTLKYDTVLSLIINDVQTKTSNKVYMSIGKVDTLLRTDAGDDTTDTCEYLGRNIYHSTEVTLPDISIPAGEHFIQVKFKYDKLNEAVAVKFKVNYLEYVGEVTTGHYRYLIQNASDNHAILAVMSDFVFFYAFKNNEWLPVYEVYQKIGGVWKSVLLPPP